MHAKVVLQLAGPMDHLRLVWQTGETLLDSVEFEEDCEGTRYNVLVAVQEIVTNVLRHSYDEDGRRPIEVEFVVAADEFRVEVRDQGEEFDPMAYDPGGAVALEEMPAEAGGFGIHIARMVMDQLSYERRDGWNCLGMVKGVGVQASL